ncbi:uncharacterized protein [Taeniopygia guttata]|uniref:uncharacterized protein n=1 Tax=Taeniopygia guttata TaxID=59729 RepID=UPI003BB874F5
MGTRPGAACALQAGRAVPCRAVSGRTGQSWVLSAFGQRCGAGKAAGGRWELAGPGKGGCRADVSAGRACRRRQLPASDQSRHRQQPGRRAEPGQSRLRRPRRPAPGAGGCGSHRSAGGSPARPSARPGEGNGPAAASPGTSVLPSARLQSECRGRASPPRRGGPGEAGGCGGQSPPGGHTGCRRGRREAGREEGGHEVGPVPAGKLGSSRCRHHAGPGQPRAAARPRSPFAGHEWKHREPFAAGDAFAPAASPWMPGTLQLGRGARDGLSPDGTRGAGAERCRGLPSFPQTSAPAGRRSGTGQNARMRPSLPGQPGFRPREKSRAPEEVHPPGATGAATGPVFRDEGENIRASRSPARIYP